MDYWQALRVGRVDLSDRGRGGRIDEAITAMRAHAFFCGVGRPAAAEPRLGKWQVREPDTRSRLTQALDRAKVKRRVAKRWASRLVREGLPRAARLTGPRGGR